MGISGLLPFIKNSCRASNIKDFKGASVAVDAYSWLHKGAFSCAEKLAKGEKTDGYVHYCMKHLNMLIDAGVKVVMVFDGRNLESKAVTEKKRHEIRERTKQRGKEFLCEGKLKEARECFQRSVDVTPEMAQDVIKACRKKNVDCIVAPYEADAQLAYLCKMKMVQIVITEDSDLVLFGCEKIFFKMDGCGGGILYEKENLHKSFGANAHKMSFEKFRYMCILSGCDYLPSLPGIGLAKACKFLKLTNNPDIAGMLSKLPSYLNMSKLEVTPEYIEGFIRANNTFLYQLVFCPQEKALVPLNPYPEGTDPSEMKYAGEYLADNLAYEISRGTINIRTMKRFDKEAVSAESWDSSSIWDAQKQPVSPLKQKNKGSFKFKQPPIQAPMQREIKKRTSMQQNMAEHNVEEMKEQDKILFSEYAGLPNPPLKKQKNMDDNVDNTKTSNSVSPKHDVFRPFKKHSPTESPKVPIAGLQKVVRSRFFVGSDGKKPAIMNDSIRCSWLDTIENEYKSNPQPLSSLSSNCDPNDSPQKQAPSDNCNIIDVLQSEALPDNPKDKTSYLDNIDSLYRLKNTRRPVTRTPKRLRRNSDASESDEGIIIEETSPLLLNNKIKDADVFVPETCELVSPKKQNEENIIIKETCDVLSPSKNVFVPETCPLLSPKKQQEGNIIIKETCGLYSPSKSDIESVHVAETCLLNSPVRTSVSRISIEETCLLQHHGSVQRQNDIIVNETCPELLIQKEEKENCLPSPTKSRQLNVQPLRQHNLNVSTESDDFGGGDDLSPGRDSGIMSGSANSSAAGDILFENSPQPSNSSDESQSLLTFSWDLNSGESQSYAKDKTSKEDNGATKLKTDASRKLLNTLKPAIKGKCKTLGLPKTRRPKSDKQSNVKETLFNFNFTRSPKTITLP